MIRENIEETCRYHTSSILFCFTFSVLTVLGGALIIISISALRNVASPEQGMDRALMETMESTGVKGLSKLLSIPFELLTACKNAIVSVLLFPFRLVTSTLARLGHAGNSTVDMIHRWVQWVANLPAQLFHSLVGVLGDRWHAVTNKLSDRSHQAMVALSASFLRSFFRNHR